MEYQVGQQVGDYQILEVLGAGGMGRVYKVRNIISQRIEAMKVLLADLEGNPELFDRFLREIRVLASLNHPHIAGLHTAQRAGNQVLMLMEFVEGESLDQVMRRGRIPLPQTVQYIQQTLSALHYAHQLGVVHRDIKPANIMIDREGKARLTDFGIALAQQDQRMTRAGHTVGSLFYMSPEQINGDPTIDRRSDLYSLGITLYEMATGRRPFQGDSDFSIMAAHLNAAPTPPREVDPEVPPLLSQIVVTAIAKDPAQRFQTAEAMRQALNHVFSGLPDAEPTATLARPGTAPAHPAPGAHPSPAAGPHARPQPAAPVQPVAMKKGSGARLLWLLAGSLVTVAVLVIAAIQLPFFRSTIAGTQDTPPPVQETPLPEPPNVPPPQADPPAQQPVEENLPAQPVPADPKPGGARPPVVSRPQQSNVARPPAQSQSNPPPQQPVVQQPVVQQPVVQQRVVQQPPVVQPRPASSANSAAVAEQRQRMIEIATRTGPIRRSIDTLRQAQARSGLGLRRDFETAEQRVIFLMDEAEAALKRGDAAAAEKHLDGAEISLRFLETNLGR